jgi:hypothetical protein
MKIEEILKTVGRSFINATITFRVKGFTGGEYSISNNIILSTLEAQKIQADLLEIENLDSFEGWGEVFVEEKGSGNLTLHKGGNSFRVCSWEEDRADRTVSFKDFVSKVYET